MKRFPFARLRPKAASIRAHLHYNPYSNLPPTILHEIRLQIEPIQLGSDAARPDRKTLVDSTVVFGALRFDTSEWNALGGTHRFEGYQNGSFYVSEVHNPVTVRELHLRYRGGALYDADVIATFDFENHHSGYINETTRLVFPATHRGVQFSVPIWAKPDEVKFPEDWRIPSSSSDWPPAVIREFVGRFVDLSQYVVTIEGRVLVGEPAVA